MSNITKQVLTLKKQIDSDFNDIRNSKVNNKTKLALSKQILQFTKRGQEDIYRNVLKPTVDSVLSQIRTLVSDEFYNQSCIDLAKELEKVNIDLSFITDIEDYIQELEDEVHNEDILTKALAITYIVENSRGLYRSYSFLDGLSLDKILQIEREVRLKNCRDWSEY